MNRSEIKYIIYCAIFSIGYFFLALPRLVKIINGNVLLQFTIFTLGIIVVLNIYLKSRSIGSKINFVKSLEYLFVVLAISIFIPPYSVVPWTGEIQNTALLQSSSVDFFFGFTAHEYLGLNGILVSIWTFVVVPIALLFIASKVSKSSFVKQL